MSIRKPARIMMSCPGGNSTTPHGICTFCGRPKETVGGAYISWAPDEMIPEHETEDIIAELKAGYFG